MPKMKPSKKTNVKLAGPARQTKSLNLDDPFAIEGFGGQFLQEVRGSYSAIVGLPLFQVRTALEHIGVFSLIAICAQPGDLLIAPTDLDVLQV